MEKIALRNLADIEALESMPVERRIVANSTYELIEKGAAINPQAPAIQFLMKGEAWDQPLVVTYAQLIGRIRQTANLLSDLGVGPTDVVSYLLPSLPHTHFVLWGAETVGIANPINPLLEAEAIRDLCLAAGTKVMVALGNFPGSEIWPKVERIRREIPTLKAIIRVMGPSEKANGIYGFDEEIDRYAADRLTFKRRIDRHDIASLYHTGGTTGRPKLARRTHYNEVVLAWDIAVASGLQAGETVMCGLPLFHCNGTCVTGLMPFFVGGQVVLLSPTGYRDPGIMKNFFKIVERYRAVFFSCVPTVLSVLLDIPSGDTDISSLRYALCGAAPLSVELFQRFEEKTGLKILEGYGLTETACASAANPRDGERKVGSIGLRLPYHWIKILILDEVGLKVREAKLGEIGAVCINGPCVFKGYVEDIHNRGIWAEEGWFNTGDLGRMDEDGYLWLTGRRKELIIRGGHNIDPATIEEALYQIPEIKVAAAVGRPDAHAGEVPVAYVELTAGATITAAEILERVRQKIGERAAIPKEIVIIDQIPLTAIGKIFKPALKFDAIRKTYQQELSVLVEKLSSLTVSVRDDKKHGTLATIGCRLKAGNKPEAVKAEIDRVLSRFTVRYEVLFE